MDAILNTFLEAEGSIRPIWSNIGIQEVQWSQLSATVALKFILTLIGLWTVQHIIYNLYFHPLANYPGPLLARITLIWRFWHSLRGRFHRVIETNHQKYGDVFRVSPNELSFCTVSAYKTIYGTRTSAELKVPKAAFYDMFGAGFSEPCISCEKDPSTAGAKRSLFSGAFSAKSLGEQEAVLQRCINTFVAKVGKLGGGDEGLDMRKWYEMVSFDILGEMAFGESFNCIENESSHFWLDMILGHVFAISVMDNLNRYPLLMAAIRSLPKKWTTSKLSQRQSDFSREKVKRRLEKRTEQTDFLSTVAKKVLNGEVSQEEMAAHSSTFVIAGGETTATSMTAITYYLLRSPSSHDKLKREVRSRFNSIGEIDITNSGQLPYLQAVIKEGMRILPANSQGLPRRSPGIEVDGNFVPEGTEFHVSPWTMAHDTRYWHDPFVFKPERWTDAECKDIKAASQPFSMGPRACIGKNFAYAQMSLELAKLVYAYDMELVDKHLDYEAACRMHFMWWKPEMKVRFRSAKDCV
ncbi:cytochrome P450 [Xylaria cf. heliscus]|nr:cytochrome P450 [Xylaria cf. heliscus]